jgi:hypothetical protein
VPQTRLASCGRRRGLFLGASPSAHRQKKTKTDSTTQRIAELNDLCRKAMGVAGRVFQTQGIAALPLPDQSAIWEKVELFDSFTEDNDPHGEHDFGAFEHEGQRIFWKIDYYAPDMEHGTRTPPILSRPSGF